MELYNIQSKTEFFCFKTCDWFRRGGSHICFLLSSLRIIFSGANKRIIVIRPTQY